MLIDKHNIPHEKLKHVTHPSGKKFMGLMLEIINIAIKEIMMKKYKNSNFNKSLDIYATKTIVEKVHQLESEHEHFINDEIKQIRERISVIQSIINEIQNESEVMKGMEFEEFINLWHDFLKNRAHMIKKGNKKINEIYENARQIVEKYQRMLSNDTKVSTTCTSQLNFLIENIRSSLPVIKQFIENYPIEESVVTQNERRLVKNKEDDLQELNILVKDVAEKCKNLNEVTMKAYTAFQARTSDESLLLNETVSNSWNFSILKDPSYHFDSKGSMMHFDPRKFTNLAFVSSNNKQSNIINHTMINPNVFKIPDPKSIHIPSRRHRTRAVDVLNQATSSVPTRLQASFRDQSLMMARKDTFTSTPLSSTMMSNNGLHNFALNISGISDISVLSVKNNRHQRVQQNLYSKNSTPEIVLTEASFEEETAIMKTLKEEEDMTICNKENFGCEIDTLMPTAKKKEWDEDLMNVSDSCLTEEY